MGKPPHKKRRSLKWKFIGGVVLVLLLFGMPVGDIVNGFVKPHEGCRVWQVTDGDTVKIWCNDGSYPARILAYDTPELKARCSSELLMAVRATLYLRWLLWRAKKITVKIDGVDRYQRKLVILLLDGEGVARRMVEAGLACWYDGGRRAGWCETPRNGPANG
ncbi:thermonuclease family protein [Profundibacter sp.]|uniref:thermonuclease family protein n=1 Tax=Profundibacter sp. TaxID=3101071 RepID=UPI003D13192B